MSEVSPPSGAELAPRDRGTTPAASAASATVGGSDAPPSAASVPASASPSAAPVPPSRPTPPPSAPAAPAASSSGPDTEVLRRRWPEVLAALGPIRRNTWALVSQRAQVHSLDATTLRLAFETPGLADRFRSDTDHAAAVARAVREQLGFDVRVEGFLLDDVMSRGPVASRGGPAGAVPGPGTAPGVVSREQAAASWDTSSARPVPAAAPPPTPRHDPPDAPAAASSTRPPRIAPDAPPRPAPSPSADAVPGPFPEPSDEDDPGPDDLGPAGPGGDLPPWDVPDARAATPALRPDGPAASARAAAAAQAAAARPVEPDDPSPDDPDISSSGLVGAPLVAQILGGRVIDEQVDESIR